MDRKFCKHCLGEEGSGDCSDYDGNRDSNRYVDGDADGDVLANGDGGIGYSNNGRIFGAQLIESAWWRWFCKTYNSSDNCASDGDGGSERGRRGNKDVGDETHEATDTDDDVDGNDDHDGDYYDGKCGGDGDCLTAASLEAVYVMDRLCF